MPASENKLCNKNRLLGMETALMNRKMENPSKTRPRNKTGTTSQEEDNGMTCSRAETFRDKQVEANEPMTKPKAMAVILQVSTKTIVVGEGSGWR